MIRGTETLELSERALWSLAPARVAEFLAPGFDDRAVIDAILRHVARTGGQDPFERPFQRRAPPQA